MWLARASTQRPARAGVAQVNAAHKNPHSMSKKLMRDDTLVLICKARPPLSLRARHHVDYSSGTVGDSVPVPAHHGRRGAAQRHAQQQQNKEETRGKKEEEYE